MDRIAQASADDREVLAIVTAISTSIAAYPPSAEVEIPGTFLDRAFRRFAGKGRGTGR
jgi:hypothetical protein